MRPVIAFEVNEDAVPAVDQLLKGEIEGLVAHGIVRIDGKAFAAALRVMPPPLGSKKSSSGSKQPTK